MYEDYSWREKRCKLKVTGPYPYFIDTHLTTLPEGNAHYSMYGIRKQDAKAYQKLYTKEHVIYPHYSSEIIIDAETERALLGVLSVCKEKNWTYFLFKTGSGSAGGHIHIEREAEPSDILYLRDRMFIERHFDGIPDIDIKVLHPMHLIRGIGRYHETTGIMKQLDHVHYGSVVPSVVDMTVHELLLERHARIRHNYKQTINSDWTRIQNVMLRHNPEGVTVGSRYTALFCLSKDLFKCGFNYTVVEFVAAQFANEFEAPSEAPDISKAVADAHRAVNRG